MELVNLKPKCSEQFNLKNLICIHVMYFIDKDILQELRKLIYLNLIFRQVRKATFEVR
jgi:hypothetical protein